jgi:hypothetical protein
MTIRQMKKCLENWARIKNQHIPPGFRINPRKGQAFRELLGRFKTMEMGVVGSKIDGPTRIALKKYTPPSVQKKYKIGTLYRAIHHSGLRNPKQIERICIHCTQYDDPKTPDKGAEILGGMTQTKSYQASPHCGIDDDSIQQYLPPTYRGWQVLGDNAESIGIEFFGFAHWSTVEWNKHEKMLDMGAWYIAKQCKKYNIPIRLLTEDQIRRGWKGIETHALVTKAFNIRGGHTDPGLGFPMGSLLSKARAYLRKM